MNKLTEMTVQLQPCLYFIFQFNVFFNHNTALAQSTSNEPKSIEHPYFDIWSSNVSAVSDEPAVLKCRVRNKGSRTVSWMRKRDLHILTTGINTYTGDQRFSVLHSPGSDDWHLKIDYVQPKDSGTYECQVNTEPKINLAVSLKVNAKIDVRDKKKAQPTSYDAKVAHAKILGSAELHVKQESTIALSCSVNIHASSVLWYHGSVIVDFDSQRGGINLETEKTDIGTTSRLMMTRASFRDSGNYTCVPSGAAPASVRVHVLTGEQPVAMQTSTSRIFGHPSPNVVVEFCALTVIFWYRYSTISQFTFSVMKRNFCQ